MTVDERETDTVRALLGAADPLGMKVIRRPDRATPVSPEDWGGARRLPWGSPRRARFHTAVAKTVPSWICEVGGMSWECLLWKGVIPTEVFSNEWLEV